MTAEFLDFVMSSQVETSLIVNVSPARTERSEVAWTEQ
ncbi:MAG: hypothetical protein QOH39_1205 [Verrucomicrobiota bacterium]|jgi:hypothetical protein